MFANITNQFSFSFFGGGAFWMVDMRNITAKMSLCHNRGNCFSHRQESCLDSGYKDGGDLLVLRVSELEKCSDTKDTTTELKRI